MGGRTDSRRAAQARHPRQQAHDSEVRTRCPTTRTARPDLAHLPQNHAADIWACEVFQVSDAWFRALFVFVLIRHANREIVHVNVTRYLTDTWVAQQLREATPYDQGPRFLIRDNDCKFGRDFSAAADAAGIDVVTIPPKSPNLNAVCERCLGGLRRDCLDNALILGEDQLRRVLTEWVRHFNEGRPHQGLGQRIPSRSCLPDPPERRGQVVAFPVLGRLYHDYRWAA